MVFRDTNYSHVYFPSKTFGLENTHYLTLLFVVHYRLPMWILAFTTRPDRVENVLSILLKTAKRSGGASEQALLESFPVSHCRSRFA